MISIDAASSERIDSWKNISSYLGRDVSTVIRWEKDRGLPVHRIPGGRRQAVFAYRHELDQWMAGLEPANGVGVGHPAATGAIRAAVVEEDLANQVPVTPLPESSPVISARRRWRTVFAVAGFVAALLLLFSAYARVRPFLSLATPQLIGQRQLTDNGMEKKGLIAAGDSVYFGQEQNGWFALAEMPVDGGPIHVLWNPQANVSPAGVSSDGKELLALCGKGVEEERELWIVPLGAGEPQRLSNITAHSAALAPDGRTIAYASGTGIYFISETDAVPREAGQFAGVPRGLYWSQDSQHLRFVLDGALDGKGMQWGEVSNDSSKTIVLRSLPPSMDGNRTQTPLVGKDAYFVWNGAQDMAQTQVWLMRSSQRWWETAYQMTPVPFVHGELDAIAFAPSRSRLLVLNKPKQRTAFVRYDSRTQAFRPILPGASGTFLSYSPDGNHVTYVSYQDNSLWLSRADGSGARPLTFPPDAVELPRWSPDGRQVAYMMQRPGNPWRIFILDVETGKTREASKSDDSQGAPTWSPDGKFIAYGGVNCEETHSCAIHRIDLATGKVQTLPDSDGLFTARWSPDGRLIAALHLEQHQLMVFNVKAEKWRKLADGISGTDLGWSADSKYLYIDLPGKARIVRIFISDGRQETVLDVRAQDNFNLAETEDLQFSLAPDDAVILHRQIHSPEIFAYDLRMY